MTQREEEDMVEPHGMCVKCAGILGRQGRMMDWKQQEEQGGDFTRLWAQGVREGTKGGRTT